jgi:hypothetical protein
MDSNEDRDSPFLRIRRSLTMRLWVTAAVAFALASQAAHACQTVDLPPRQRFHNATMIVRATAHDMFEFSVKKTWRGNAAAGSRLVAKYNPIACGSAAVNDDADYIVYSDAPPAFDEDVIVLHEAHMIPADTGKRHLVYLDAQPSKPLSRLEVARELSEWQSGRQTMEQLNRWIAEADTRDVDDWRESSAGDWSLVHELFWRLPGWTQVRPMDPEDDRTVPCGRETVVRSHVAGILRLFRWPPATVEECQGAIDELDTTIGDETEPLGC